MKLALTLKLFNLGETTHIWFPVPAGDDKEIESWFNISPTEIQTDKKYGNKIAYFYLSKKDSPFRTERTVLNKIQIEAIYPITQREFFSANTEQYLRPNRFVQSDDKTVIDLAESLTKNCKLDEEKARHCFDFVIGYLTYANPIRGLYSTLQALTDRNVDCGGFSTLLVALFRSIKIPARCVFGWALQSKFGYHAWVEYYDRQKGAWISVDPSVVHLGNRTNLDAGLGFINDDRVFLSVGEDIELIGNGIKWTTPLLQSPVVVSLNHIDIPANFKQSLDWTAS